MALIQAERHEDLALLLADLDELSWGGDDGVEPTAGHPTPVAATTATAADTLVIW